MKPDWCPQDVWAITGMEFDELYEQEGALEGGCEHGIRVSMAKLVLQARSQAFEESAKIAENYRTNMAFWMGLDLETARQATEIAGHDISQAIRQHSQKGRDK